jgi:hypothetical protein
VKSVLRSKTVKEAEMRTSIYGILRSAVLPAAFVILTSCIMAPAGHQGPGVVMIPPLPAIVVLVPQDPYYYQSGYYYYYRDNRWFYSHNKSGPWQDLPRENYPREVRFKDRDDDRGRDWKHGDDEGDRDWKHGNDDGYHH